MKLKRQNLVQILKVKRKSVKEKEHRVKFHRVLTKKKKNCCVREAPWRNLQVASMKIVEKEKLLKSWNKS